MMITQADIVVGYEYITWRINSASVKCKVKHLQLAGLLLMLFPSLTVLPEAELLLSVFLEAEEEGREELLRSFKSQ